MQREVNAIERNGRHMDPQRLVADLVNSRAIYLLNLGAGGSRQTPPRTP